MAVSTNSRGYGKIQATNQLSTYRMIYGRRQNRLGRFRLSFGSAYLVYFPLLIERSLFHDDILKLGSHYVLQCYKPSGDFLIAGCDDIILDQLGHCDLTCVQPAPSSKKLNC
jgi:hypothetical protein